MIMEDKNMARVELKDMELEDVVGGAFNFYVGRTSGKLLCYVDGIGTYEANSASRDNVTYLCFQYPELSASELVNLALQNGYLAPYVK